MEGFGARGSQREVVRICAVGVCIKSFGDCMTTLFMADVRKSCLRFPFFPFVQRCILMILFLRLVMPPLMALGSGGHASIVGVLASAGVCTVGHCLMAFSLGV